MQAPGHIINHRRELCQRCKTPCEFQNNEVFRAEGDNVCPIGKWMAFQTFVKAKIKGLGDVVEKLADPIARLSDRVFKTKIKGCSACAKRKEMLNHLVPWGQKPQ